MFAYDNVFGPIAADPLNLNRELKSGAGKMLPQSCIFRFFPRHGYMSSENLWDASVGESAETQLVDLGRRYRPALLAFFSRRLDNAGDAEDMTHEILLKLAELPANEIRNPEAYIFRMASNLIRDRHRQNKVRDAYRFERSEIECRAADYIDPLRLLEGKEQLGLVSKALAGLPQRTRDILLLFRIERIRKREIADSFGISVSAVDKHLIRATAHLAKSLEDEA